MTSHKSKSKPQVTSSIDTMRADEKRWRTEDAMRTLMRADELKQDKALMRDVQKMAAEQAKKMSGLCGKAK
ncbi:hypothetical protein ACFFP0_24580 [Rhizobium puerariae]|uniref:Transcriptional regulator n=1 Tax=Rhizobium puerariae TaxID=1585791 RepID=A0ABV6AN46_9HYPH